MKIYNKKGFLSGIFWIVLALWSIIHDFGSPNPNTMVQIRDSIISLFLLLMGINSFWRAFSKKATKEDIVEEHDERNRLIKYKSQSRMLDIAYAILFVFMVCGMIVSFIMRSMSRKAGWTDHGFIGAVLSACPK